MYRAERNATNLWLGQVTLPGGNSIGWQHVPKEKLSEFVFGNAELLDRVLQHIERDIAEDAQQTSAASAATPRVYFPDTVIDAKELAPRGYSRGVLTSRIAELAQRRGIASESIAGRYLALKAKWMTQEVRLPVVDLSLPVLPAIFSLTLIALWQLLMLSAGLRGAQSPVTWDPDPTEPC